jgi:hypothetical protein
MIGRDEAEPVALPLPLRGNALCSSTSLVSRGASIIESTAARIVCPTIAAATAGA